MLTERIWIHIAFLSTVLWCTLLVMFVCNNVSWVKSLGLFIQTPMAVGNKYRSEARPGIITMTFVWLLVINSKLSSLIWLIRTKERVFPKEFYMRWAAGMLLTVVWMFLYDREMNVLNYVVVNSICVLGMINVVRACQRLELSKSELADSGLQTLPESVARGFKRIVITNSNVEVVWSLTALPVSIAFPVAYLDSFGIAEAVPRGIVSVETASLLGLWSILVIQMCYTVLDFSEYRLYTKHLSLLHPGIILVVLGSFFSHYDSDVGITPSGMNNLMIAAFSCGAFSIRHCKPDENEKKLN